MVQTLGLPGETVTWPHHLLRYLVSDLGEPHVVVRLGYVDSADPLPPVPRRAAADVIEVFDQEPTEAR